MSFETDIHTSYGNNGLRLQCVRTECVEFYLYPTVSTALIHLIKPGLMK